MKLEVARSLAAELVELLRPYCERIEVAGGIRRKKQEPHDIELVAIPRMRKEVVSTPLGTTVDTGHFLNALDERMRLLDTLGTIQRGDPSETTRKSRLVGTEKVLVRAPFGDKYYRVKYKGEKIDLFVVISPKCLSCGAILKESNAGKEVVGALQEEVRPVWELLRGSESSILFPGVPQASDEGEESGALRSLPETLLQAPLHEREGLQHQVWGNLSRIEEDAKESKVDRIPRPVPNLEARQTDRIGVRPSLHASAPERNDEGVDYGASLDNGAAPGAVLEEGRGGAPSERNQERQPLGKSRTGYARPQRWEGPMPLLWDVVSRSLRCPHCDSDKIKFENSWGAVFAIRTGDKDYSHWLVQQGYARGIHETSGHLEVWTHEGYETLVTTATAPYPSELRRDVLQTPEEADFFKALGVPWIEPEGRTYEATRSASA